MIIDVGAHRYKDPWNLSFEKRLRCLKQRHIKVAYFYEKADNSTFRYRVYNPVNVLNQLSEDISASYFFRDDYLHLERVIQAADILVVCRSKYTHEINELITRFRSQGKSVFYDIDDLVFDVRYAPLVAETIGIDLKHDHGWDVWFAYVSRHGAALQLCDACITTNRHLARKLGEYSGLPVRIMRNFMNAEQLNISSRVREHRDRAPRRWNEEIRIGYFSGTPTHAKDFEVSKPGILELMKDDRRIQLVIAGHMAVDIADRSIRARVHHLPFTDFINLQRAVGSVDINVAPLTHNAFTDCKSELKFFEAAAVRTATVATPTAVYKDCIHHGVSGLLSPAHEWKNQLTRLIEDDSLRAGIIEEGQAVALTHYSWQTRLEEVRAALGLAPSLGPQNIPSPTTQRLESVSGI